jgi:hypothetical protein
MRSCGSLRLNVGPAEPSRATTTYRGNQVPTRLSRGVATATLDQSAPPEEVQSMLGHTDP